MLKGRGRDPRGTGVTSPTPPHLQSVLRPPGMTHSQVRPTTPSMHRAPAMRPEPDYEVVEFPSEQYVNAKLQPPPPPPPRPPTGHPLDAEASCGLCGGGGARVRCAECGRRALCASCDDMYHRHPKRRNHQRQALSQSQLRDERPPLPPKVAPPVPPPRRHKIGGERMSASPRPLTTSLDQRRATLNHISAHIQNPGGPLTNHHPTTEHMHQQIPLHLQTKIKSTPTPSHLGSMPFLPTNMHIAAGQAPGHTNTISHTSSGWNRARGQHGFGIHQNQDMQPEPWESSENMGPSMQNSPWGRPLRKGASVLELGGGTASTCVGCAHCAPMPWRYGSCASLDHPWAAPNPGWAPACCTPPHLTHNAHVHQHPHVYPPQTPQPFRRGETRTVSRAVSRAGSRAASPAMSIRSRTSRRHKHRTPSPPPLPSSDADSESENESDHELPAKPQENDEDNLGPAPPPPTSTWQCEHCTFVNEPGVRVCIICCRTPTASAKPIPYQQDVSENMERLNITTKKSLSPAQTKDETRDKPSTKTKKERTSTGCGPSPPRENNTKKTLNRLVTPVRESNVNNRYENSREKHDIAVGASPPREVPNEIQRQNRQDIPTDISQSRVTNRAMKVSPYKGASDSPKSEAPKQHSISVGPSPPREISVSQKNSTISDNNPKKSTGTSPPRENSVDRRNVVSGTKFNVSNTGTSPPPQSISTQTYEVPNSWERAPSTTRSRPRRRFRDDGRRERSHSRHSLSSDTRESERSVRTAGPEQRWEWRERDSSPGGDWGDGYNRLSRRASHLDLRRTRSTRRSSFYGSEAPSPEWQSSNRAISLEALAGAGARREAERGIELAQLMGEAEKFGFSAAEVQAALSQSPTAPLTWLRERWPSLCAGVRAAAARLQPNATITELEARAALARHKGAMWPAVTECVERHRRQVEVTGLGEEGRHRGHVWGSPVGVDDDAAPPRSSSRHSHRIRAEDSSDEFEAPALPKFQEDDWMYLPLNINTAEYHKGTNRVDHLITEKHTKKDKEDISENIETYLREAGAPSIDETIILKELLSTNSVFELDSSGKMKTQPVDFIQYENDFIDAYNALTKLSPIPNINDKVNKTKGPTVNEPEKKSGASNIDKIVSHPKRNVDDGKGQHKKNGKRDKFSINKEVEKLHTNEIMSQDVIEEKINASNNLNGSVTTVEKGSTNFENTLLLEDDAAHDTQRQIDEKQNNLSDMVDNTQRLIQQMKEEINSDINSIDERTGTQSEIDISSEESNDEQESSYSGTEEGTDNLTSEEEEISSSEEEIYEDNISEKINSKEEPSDKRLSIQTRTSSEDNENFEEALDHIDNQLEDFRHANIEILNSITRTLNDVNTLPIKTSSQDNSKEKVSAILKEQDLNNNLFVTVHSFDEIYEELNNRSTNIPTQIEPPLVVEPVMESGVIELLSKETIIYSSIKTSPVKIFISEIKQPISNGKLEIFEDDQDNEEHPDTQSTSDNIRSESVVLNDNTNVNNTKQAISNALLANLENYNNFNQNIVLNIDPHLVQEELNGLRSNDTFSEVPQLDPEKQKSNQRFKNQKIDYHDLSIDATVSESLEKNEQNNQNLVNDIIITEPVNNNQKNHTFENVATEKSKENNNIKNNTPNKSNIPKLVKILPNTKTKIDNHSPKLIVSKVPIRRASLKQYPAPEPPKGHFGNIRNGHVKQLQTRLFNSKSIPPKLVTVPPSEPKATTSKLNKKKPAPQPPVKVEEIQSSPPKTPTPSKVPPEKKPYFRETCRTEDEWTDSDSEDSQVQIVKPSEEPQYSPPSPPPPATLRRVSGQLIDLAKIRLPEGSPERQARMLLAEGAMETWEQAQLAVELVSRGAEAPAALLAALECTDLNSALAYLFQDCELCASRLPEHEMVSMLRCTHRCCRECAHHYFTVQITERSIVDCVCPYCKLPELETLPEDTWLEYFAHLDILLKTLLEVDVHELFQRKLRDRTLARDPNFRWCMECSSGFFVHPKQKRIRCPECRSVSCASCRKPWNANHEGLTCDQYTAWLEDNDPERSVNAIQQHLRDNGLECPRCHFKYSLSRGGCMHFTCTQCKYEFCYGCGKPFTMGARCGLSDYCAKLGLHAHHPRNCLFYLRDKEPHELQTLLQMNNVNYETEPAEGGTGRCPIQLQRETPTGLVDSTCGHEAPTNFAGLCKAHYVEYLAGLARGLDPLPIMDVPELVAELRRRALPLPERGPWDTDPIYAGMCAEIVKEKIPLD